MDFESYIKSNIHICIYTDYILLTVRLKIELPSAGRFLKTDFKSSYIFQLDCTLLHMKGHILIPSSLIALHSNSLFAFSETLCEINYK